LYFRPGHSRAAENGKAKVEKLIKTVFGLLLRVLLLGVGLVFLAGVLMVTALLLGVWGLRALWARLSGRPVQPLAFTILRRAQWQRFYRPGAAQTARDADVIDVESRQVDGPASDRLGR
jgi:hypothetical protein